MVSAIERDNALIAKLLVLTPQDVSDLRQKVKRAKTGVDKFASDDVIDRHLSKTLNLRMDEAQGLRFALEHPGHVRHAPAVVVAVAARAVLNRPVTSDTVWVVGGSPVFHSKATCEALDAVVTSEIRWSTATGESRAGTRECSKCRHDEFKIDMEPRIDDLPSTAEALAEQREKDREKRRAERLTQRREG